MKPHSLRLSAFGTFPGTVSLDLDALGAAGLFLLHGPTGAGKSTLLDAIGFALFGRVPGPRNDAKRLRSDYASDEARTWVELDVSFGDRRLRVTRSPEYLRPKRKGSGFTAEKAKVLLEEFADGAWVQRSDRQDEVGQEIADLVGMTATQFFQVVLLPQGSFATFLRADSKERAEVLQKLFATERFADVEAWLVQRRRATAEAVREARDDVDLLVARIAEATGAEPVETDRLPWAGMLLEQAGVAQALAHQDVTVVTTRREVARVALDAATALGQLQARRQTALAKAEALDNARPALLSLQQELDAAGRAGEVVDLLDAIAERRSARDTCLIETAQAQAGLHAIGLDLAPEVTALAGSLAGGQARLGQLDALRAIDTDRLTELEKAGQATAEAATALTAAAQLQVQLEALPLRKQQAQTRLLAGREAAERIPAVRAERDQLAALRPEVVTLVKTETRLLELTEEHLSAREAHVALARKANEVRTASLNTMVATLALSLQAAAPCPVCGSRDHPDVSSLRDEGVSAEDEQAARRAADEALQAVSELDVSLAAARATSTTLRARVAGWTPAGIDAQLSELDLDLAVLQATTADGDRAEIDVRETDALLDQAGRDHVAASGKAEAALRRAEEASGRAAIAQRQLDATLGNHPDLATALLATSALVEAVERALAAVQALTAAQLELDRAQAVAVTATTGRGFVALDEAAAAVREEAWRTETAGILREAADDQAAVAAELADPALDIPLEPSAPTAARAAEVACVDAELATATALLATCAVRRTALDRLVPVLTEALVALEPLQTQADQVRALADLCCGAGANTLKMTLTSFVLAARLEEVAAAATVRLQRMTQGRYALVHTDGAARGGARSGLGLLARDSWTGHDRDTATLSGGETFLASLALALGLADVVTAEAGGARIEALFVDEGFGTLDEDSLDEVMDVLDDLREGGRLVGLVSHVAELRQRIPARVEVRASRTGSDLVVHGC